MPPREGRKPNTTSTQVEDQTPSPKVRDRSEYNPMEHGAVRSALYGALTVLRQHGPDTSLTIKQLLEKVETTDSTLRKGFKILKEQGVIGQRGSPAEFFILNLEGVIRYLNEFENTGTQLFLKETGEANPGLH